MPAKYQDPDATVFISNIEHRVTEELLWELFLQAGPLRNVHIPSDRATGKNKSFAFITFRNKVSVSFACELFNSLKLFQRPIYCKPTDNGGKSTNTAIVKIEPTASPNYATPSRPNPIRSLGSSPSPSPQYNGGGEKEYSSYNDRSRSSDRPRYGERSNDASQYNPRDDDRSSGNHGGYRQHDDRSRRNDNEQRPYDSYPARQNYGSGGSHSPAYQQAMGNSMGQYNRSQSYENSPRNSPSNYGPIRNDPSSRDHHRAGRRQRSQPY